MDYTIPYLSTPTSLPISIPTQTSSYEEDLRNEERKHNRRRGSNVKLSTDPQSVAARERRHRISDRFKILQSLVPGGSKMDTVSMLEEAIHYVKFLKAQIWMHQTMMGGGVGVGMLNNSNTFSGGSVPVGSVPDSSGSCSCFEGGGLAGDQQQYYNCGFNEVENQPCWGNYCFQGSDQEQMLLSQVPSLDHYLP